MAERRNLLPLPTEAVPEKRTILTTKRGGHVRTRERRVKLLGEVVPDICRALNALYGVPADGAVSAAPNSAQHKAMQHCMKLGEEVCRRGLARQVATFVMSDLGTYLRGVGEAIWLDPSRVSLPLNEVAGSVEMLDVLPDGMQSQYSDGSTILKTDLSDIRNKKPFKGVKEGKYRELIVILEKNGLVELRKDKPKVINGVFGVAKQDKQRLIIDARNANSYFIEPENPNLPNPSDLSSLYVGDDAPLYLAKTDMDNFYHRLRLPRWLTEYFGLPALTRDGLTMYPVVLTVPMGWSHSVVIAQRIHEGILWECGLDKNRAIQNHNREVGRLRFGAYIDDYFSIGGDKDLANDYLQRVLVACERKGVPAKESKIVMPTLESETMIGIESCGDGVLRPDVGKMKSLLEYTCFFVKLRKWKKKDLQIVLGRWAWAILLKRCLFCVFAEVYKASEDEAEYITPTRAMRNEFRLASRLQGFIRADLRKPFSDIVLCTDASNEGGGVVYYRTTSEVSIRVSHMDIEEYHQWIRRREWITCIRYRWKELEKIHLLEGEALILGIRWFLRDVSNMATRVIIFVDNTALIGAVQKGRSSKPRFNRICQRTAALTLAGNLQLILRYVRSEDNPADGPSRFV